MSKRKKPRRRPKPANKSTNLRVAEKSIAKIAMREGTTPEKVRKHIQVSLINGLISNDEAVRAAWKQIPCAGEIPTPEEVIAFYAGKIAKNSF